ncbi:hypothetical protein ZWY2020_000328 [Hordeum vulgare]|nr:hypothetical protein ZWY2020_000328 [Hordeum vulgare]
MFTVLDFWPDIVIPTFQMPVYEILQYSSVVASSSTLACMLLARGHRSSWSKQYKLSALFLHGPDNHSNPHHLTSPLRLGYRSSPPHKSPTPPSFSQASAMANLNHLPVCYSLLAVLLLLLALSSVRAGNSSASAGTGPLYGIEFPPYNTAVADAGCDGRLVAEEEELARRTPSLKLT